MAVQETDIVWYESANGASDGGARSATPVTATKADFWPNLSDAERTAGGTRHKKSHMANNHGTDALIKPVVWVKVQPQNMTEQIGLGFDDADDDNANQGNMTALGANSVVAIVSDGPDTRAVQVYGKNAAGVGVREDLTLNGTAEVVGAVVFSTVYAVKTASESATRTVTVRQGAGGTTRGTIGPNTEMCFLWLAATTKANGIALPDLAAGGAYGFWHRQTWTAGIGAVRPNTSKIGYEES